MYKLMKKTLVALTVITLSFSAWAMSLDQAKQQGLVGEMSTGYLGVIVKSAEAESLVTTVNSKRKQLYLQLARKNKISLAQVATLAGEKALAKTRPGHFIKEASGQWVKK